MLPCVLVRVDTQACHRIREGDVPDIRDSNIRKETHGILELCVLLTVRLVIIFVNNQLDANYFFSRMFISILYMFRTATCPSSGESIVSIRHLVCVTLCR